MTASDHNIAKPGHGWADLLQQAPLAPPTPPPADPAGTAIRADRRLLLSALAILMWACLVCYGSVTWLAGLSPTAPRGVWLSTTMSAGTGAAGAATAAIAAAAMLAAWRTGGGRIAFRAAVAVAWLNAGAGICCGFVVWHGAADSATAFWIVTVATLVLLITYVARRGADRYRVLLPPTTTATTPTPGDRP